MRCCGEGIQAERPLVSINGRGRFALRDVEIRPVFPERTALCLVCSSVSRNVIHSSSGLPLARFRFHQTEVRPFKQFASTVLEIQMEGFGGSAERAIERVAHDGDLPGRECSARHRPIHRRSFDRTKAGKETPTSGVRRGTARQRNPSLWWHPWRGAVRPSSA
jgi:hypothetical protein